MDYEIVEIKSFVIQALKKRTTSENNLAKKDIEDLWQKFHSEQFSKKILNKKSEEIVSVYTEYEKDHTGSYTYYLGQKVKKITLKLKDLFYLMIPSGKYVVIEVCEPFPDSLLKTWKEVWHSDIKRTYSVDFEVYGGEYFQERDKSMKIYLSI